MESKTDGKIQQNLTQTDLWLNDNWNEMIGNSFLWEFFVWMKDGERLIPLGSLDA